MIDYTLIETDNYYLSVGITPLLNYEFQIKKRSYPEGYLKLIINYIIIHFEKEKEIIRNQDTFSCGSWLLQFLINGTYIEVHELTEIVNEENVFEFDLIRTISLLKSQLDFCSEQKVDPDLPRIFQKLAISNDIYSGSDVSGARYRSPIHMSGWFLTSNLYNGDIRSLNVDHVYHILQRRPDVAKYLALPAGFRFYKNSVAADVWFDNAVSKE